VGTISDLRQLGLGSKLLAYYDTRSSVSGAQASLTMSATLQKNIGSTSPAVTITGPLSPPRQVKCTYTTGGALGAMAYVIYLGDSVLSGTSPADGIVGIGNGNDVVFGAGIYSTADSHYSEITSHAELTGLAGDTLLTSTLAGRGARYEAYGLNGTRPRLLFNNSAFANESAIPALATGIDTAIDVTIVCESVKHISGAGASVIWGFSNQAATSNTKSYLRLLSCGPAIGSGLDSRFAIQRRDSSGAPATATLICDNLHADLDFRVFSTQLGAIAQLYSNGMFGRIGSAQSTNRGVATTTDRFTVGGGYLGTAGYSSANWWQGGYGVLAIHQPLTIAERLSLSKAALA